MRQAHLVVDDHVWVVLPYEAGRGWARILELRPTVAIVAFDPGPSIFKRDRKAVLYRHIIRKEIS